MEPAPSRVTVAVLDDAIVGSAKAGPNRPGAGSHVATASFMVDPAHAGKGIGRALAEDALAWATAEGYRSMQFNAVVETNTGAVHLWQSLGLRDPGDRAGGVRPFDRTGWSACTSCTAGFSGPDAAARAI